MSFLHELLRALFVAFGAMELITNGKYLFKKDALALARKQHGEIPANVTMTKLKCKVILMFLFGAIFFLSGLSSFLLHTYTKILYIIVGTLFSFYALCEAIYYRYWKTFSFFGVTVVLLLLCIVS